ncbi:hypothetical protein PAMC26510_03050 [Caballeronia sordidicola]|uniref:Uncharacterized protein n=1 Tax=Caballeronia sordidicola TaxID=196367 RepID=A0A2C9XVK0_CABSO|nr:hypothetical protein PAMC26510_03050 [Caballeronia sordidicola]
MMRSIFTSVSTLKIDDALGFERDASVTAGGGSMRANR